jgi:hypothetical protein
VAGMMWQKAATLVTLLTITSAALSPTTFDSPENPAPGDGTYIPADPAPFVYNDTLYIIAGRDEAPASVNDFIMNEWQIYKTSDPAKIEWTYYPAITKPNNVFK